MLVNSRHHVGSDALSNSIPINPFGEGSVSDAAREYVMGDLRLSGQVFRLDLREAQRCYAAAADWG